MTNKTNTLKLLQELSEVAVALQRNAPLRLSLPALPPPRPGLPPKRKRRIRIHSPGPDIAETVPIRFL